jgi:hypothetical protein
MNDELHNYLGRPKRYDNIDGTGEMAFGLMALGFTLLGYLPTALPKDSMWRNGFLSMVFFYAFLLLMCGLMLWVSRSIKQHVTWPRTGYVKYRTGGKARKPFWALMIAVAVLAAVIGAGVPYLMHYDRRYDWIGLLWLGNVALYVAGYAFWVYRMEKHHPWKWLIFLFMVLGLLAIALFAPGDIVGLRWHMLLFVGLTWLASGVTTLYLYIRHTQPPTPEAE